MGDGLLPEPLLCHFSPRVLYLWPSGRMAALRHSALPSVALRHSALTGGALPRSTTAGVIANFQEGQ